MTLPLEEVSSVMDPATGYGSAAATQPPEFNRILVLRDSGPTSADITRIIEASASNDELVGMPRLHQAEAEGQALSTLLLERSSPLISSEPTVKALR